MPTEQTGSRSLKSPESCNSPSPVFSAAFSIRPAGPYEITTWVKSLRNGDDAARNRAAVSLVKQGDPVLPLLQGVRSKSSEIGQWWIDAVIQQIESADLKRAAGLCCIIRDHAIRDHAVNGTAIGRGRLKPTASRG